jgi:hypothetical protein
MTYTTSVNLTPEIKKIHNSFDTLILFKKQNKQEPGLSLTPVQHSYYCSQIKDKGHRGNPFYNGYEIKRMGALDEKRN